MPKRSEGYSTVRKAMTVISAFSNGEPILGVSELARRLGLGKSTVHRILQTLLLDGYVERTRDERYRLSLRFYEIGLQVAAANELRERAHPVLERLRNDTGETAHLAVLADLDVVYVDRLESPHTLRTLTRLGRRRAAHATSSGKCLLAFGSPDAVARVISGGLPRLGPRTITDAQLLTRALDRVRHQGYAVSLEESALGFASVGAPIFAADQQCIAAVSVAGPVSRLRPEEQERLVRLVVTAGHDITVRLATGAVP